MRRLGRSISFAWMLAAASAAALAVSGAPAAGHGPSQPDAPFYRTELTGIVPAAAGVTAGVDPHGAWVRLSYTGPGEVIVLGYSGEPYLRVRAGSVEENMFSPATYLNQSMFADLPTGATIAATPSWRLVARSGTARWHDHRIHWMGEARPPVVDADLGHRHQVGAWTVHALADGRRFDVRGAVVWIGRPSGAPATREWLIMAGSNVPLVVAGLVAWLIHSRRRRQRPPPATDMSTRLAVEDRVDMSAAGAP